MNYNHWIFIYKHYMLNQTKLYNFWTNATQPQNNLVFKRSFILLITPLNSNMKSQITNNNNPDNTTLIPLSNDVINFRNTYIWLLHSDINKVNQYYCTLFPEIDKYLRSTWLQKISHTSNNMYSSMTTLSETNKTDISINSYKF